MGATQEEYLVKLPKKGDLQECQHYRGIMLLERSSTEGTLDRLKTGADAKLRGHQAGFRNDMSCTDQITTL